MLSIHFLMSFRRVLRMLQCRCNYSRSLDIVIKPDCALCSVTTGAVSDERAPNGLHCADSR